jgi:bifunctional DNA-binding transcriptional regulator/antitoxin component of YhaV-PrlF toxin-antitoxin module
MNSVSTITSKWQVTIPEDVRKELPFEIGGRIVWEVDGDKLVGRRLRTISELAGCFKSTTASPARDTHKEAAKVAIARHMRISRRKP